MGEETHESKMPNEHAMGKRSICKGCLSFREHNVLEVSSSYEAFGSRAATKLMLRNKIMSMYVLFLRAASIAIKAPSKALPS